MLRCKFARIELGLSQHQVAARAPISRTELSRIENGRSNPTPRELQRLAKVLGISADNLLDHVTDPLGAEYMDASR